MLPIFTPLLELGLQPALEHEHEHERVHVAERARTTRSSTESAGQEEKREHAVAVAVEQVAVAESTHQQKHGGVEGGSVSGLAQGGQRRHYLGDEVEAEDGLGGDEGLHGSELDIDDYLVLSVSVEPDEIAEVLTVVEDKVAGYDVLVGSGDDEGGEIAEGEFGGDDIDTLLGGIVGTQIAVLILGSDSDTATHTEADLHGLVVDLPEWNVENGLEIHETAFLPNKVELFSHFHVLFIKLMKLFSTLWA